MCISFHVVAPVVECSGQWTHNIRVLPVWWTIRFMDEDLATYARRALALSERDVAFNRLSLRLLKQPLPGHQQHERHSGMCSAKRGQDTGYLINAYNMLCIYRKIGNIYLGSHYNYAGESNKHVLTKSMEIANLKCSSGPMTQYTL